jgi:protein-tyrosine phosphatase
MLLTIAGVPEQTVIEDYALTATLALPLLERLRAAALERGADPAHMDRILASKAQTMQSMLDHLDDQHGGIDSYLGRIGIEEQTLGMLARRLVADPRL